MITNLDSVKGEHLPSLSDLTLENNPIEKMPKFQLSIKEKFPTVQYLNLQKLTIPVAAPPTKVTNEEPSKLGGKDAITDSAQR
jgi:hypothetical protein